MVTRLVLFLDLIVKNITVKITGSMNSNAMISPNALKEVVSPGCGVGKGFVDNITESEITLIVSLRLSTRKSSCFEES